MKPEYVLVVPDGPLHQLPLEALMVDRMSPRFLADDLPPTAYVPSLHIMAAVSETSSPPAESLILLVGDTVHSPNARPENSTKPGAHSATTERGGHRSRLEFSAQECTNVENALKQLKRNKSLLYLSGERSTEASVRREIAQKGRRIACLLFSCHADAEADDDTRELFGSLELSATGNEAPPHDDDGLLELHEIHQLPLSGCELAVLSACQTVVGKKRPLESGSTLARSFMVAGVRRVVCTHWRVNDQSTADLVKYFFDNIAAQSQGESVEINLAVALHAARRQVREAGTNQTVAKLDYSSAYHWAPFVLIGPPVVEKDHLLGTSN